jgi:hypothetical protein
MDRLGASDTAQVLWWVIKRGFVRHIVGPVEDPRVVVLFYDWGTYVDVAHVRGAGRTEAARIPKRIEQNLYRPDVVVWHHWGGTSDALHGLMLLPAPVDGGPTRPYHPPRNQPPFSVDGAHEALTVYPEELDEVHIRLSNYRIPDQG